MDDRRAGVHEAARLFFDRGSPISPWTWIHFLHKIPDLCDVAAVNLRWALQDQTCSEKCLSDALVVAVAAGVDKSLVDYAVAFAPQGHLAVLLEKDVLWACSESMLSPHEVTTVKSWIAQLNTMGGKCVDSAVELLA